MNIIGTLVTDRTQADADRVRSFAKRGWKNLTDAEQAEWAAGMKGAYNASDLNRVSDAADYLASRFRAAGYNPKGVLRILDEWMDVDTPTESQMRQYLGNIEVLRSLLAVMETTPETPETMEGLTVDAANAIEQILVDVDHLLTNSQQAVYYSGDVFAGEI